MKTLFINASILGTSKMFAKEYMKKINASNITEIDLNTEIQGNVNSTNLSTWYSDTPKYIELLKSHDEIVIAAPIVDFLYAPSLKAFVDKISLAGTTFKYTENGVAPLITEFADKKVTLILTSGTQKEFLPKPVQSNPELFKAQMNFIGFTNVEVKWLSGTNAPANYGKSPEEILEVYKDQI